MAVEKWDFFTGKETPKGLEILDQEAILNSISKLFEERGILTKQSFLDAIDIFRTKGVSSKNVNEEAFAMAIRTSPFISMKSFPTGQQLKG